MLLSVTSQMQNKDQAGTSMITSVIQSIIGVIMGVQ